MKEACAYQEGFTVYVECCSCDLCGTWLLQTSGQAVQRGKCPFPAMQAFAHPAAFQQLQKTQAHVKPACATLLFVPADSPSLIRSFLLSAMS